MGGPCSDVSFPDAASLDGVEDVVRRGECRRLGGDLTWQIKMLPSEQPNHNSDTPGPYGSNTSGVVGRVKIDFSLLDDVLEKYKANSNILFHRYKRGYKIGQNALHRSHVHQV